MSFAVRPRAPIAALLALLLIAGGPPARPLTLWLIGDSTMADKPDPDANPERGWGQALPRFVDGDVTVRNHAVNGRSTRSFIAEGRWDSVRTRLRAGDVVVIQFGHNDEKTEDPARYTNPYTAYRANLVRFVLESRARGAMPIVASPIVRRTFNDKGTLLDTHGVYPWVARAVAQELHAPFVDLQLLTETLVTAAGPERSKALYVWTTANEFPRFPLARQDDTHLSPAGADSVARLAVEALQAMDTPLRGHLRVNTATR